MILFHSDLDNTLIYSYRHDIGKDKKCVEYYQGQEFAFMTTKSQAMLRETVEKVIFIPTTTRTQSQYERIRLGIGQPEYALVCNGGILLKNGVPDKTWYLETISMIQEAEQELETGIKILDKDSSRCFELQFINHLFLYTKSKAPEESAKRLRELLDLDKVYIHIHNAKIYVMPQKLTKGIALERMKNRMNGVFTVAAGDAELDRSMIEAADRGIAPSSLNEKACFGHKVRVVPEGEIFSDAVLVSVLEMTESQTDSYGR